MAKKLYEFEWELTEGKALYSIFEPGRYFKLYYGVIWWRYASEKYWRSRLELRDIVDGMYEILDEEITDNPEEWNIL